MPNVSRRALLALSAAAPLALPAIARAASPADAKFETLAKGWVDASLRLSPVSATQIGDHRFDDLIDDMGPAGRAAVVKLATETLAALQATPRAELSRANQVDAAILENQVRSDLWTIQTLQPYAWDPLTWNAVAGGALYNLTAREFAPLEVRLRSATARMEKLPALLAQARADLVPARVPKIHADTVVGQNKGLHSLVDGIVEGGAKLPPADRARLEAAARACKAGIDAHQKWLETVLAPAARGEFRLGAELYDAKLAFALNSPLSRAEIKARALAEMTSLRATMYSISARFLAGKPAAPPTPANPTDAQCQAAIEAALEYAYAKKPARDKLVEAAEATLVEATAFVRARNIVTVPSDPVKIGLVPEFQRGVAVAYCDAPGPLDKGQQTYYKISPIPDDWTDAQADSFLREYNLLGIQEVTVHEAMPGHYLQLAHANAYPSVLRAVLSSGPFVEGWACYAQDVMADEGYLGGDPLYLLVHLKLQLRVCANALLDQAVHVDNISRDEAMKLMTVQAFQQEREAAGKWVRAQLSQAQLPTYFVGWEEHKALRKQAQAKWGKSFTLKRYHDGILSFGSPPARFAGQLLFDLPIA
ncbi:DUF885 domain-containing protein [Phenylobacterium sp.]|uniref:DUF885 domain-containing protein n=1 Tax=Phenylobacterium sp. TaxID=1871053 RepID=UPI002725EB87|nr:DUF885 domain-containing protein [Phenylobacterium sp.]MDO8802530.1 DUF885 domain-containing protein [Phenylobacterium sp.]